MFEKWNQYVLGWYEFHDNESEVIERQQNGYIENSKGLIE